jgi:aminocarboxymuconate-semialdehyde decarboxylase
VSVQQVVDAHAHHVGQDAIERIREEGGEHGVRLVTDEGGRTRVDLAGHLTGLPLIPALSDVPARLEWMAAAGVDVQLVAPWMDLAGYHLDGQAGLWLAAVQNDAAAALRRAHPDRFRTAAAVPLQEPALAAKELGRAVTELGHEAVQIGARVGELGLDDESLEVFWDAAEAHQVPVIVHPAELDVPERSRRLFLHILVGNPSETTFAAAALMLGGVLERHPRLRVLLVHGGGFVPYQIGRIHRGFTAAPPAFRSGASRGPREVLDQLLFDSVLHDDDALRHLVDFAGPGHVVLGSDYPFPMRLDSPAAALDAVELDADSRAAILGSRALWTPLRRPSPSSPTPPPRQDRAARSTS